MCISVKLNPAASVCWTRGQKPVREASGTVAVQSRKFLCAPCSRGMCFQALLLQQYAGPWSGVKDQEAPSALVLLAEEARDGAKTCREAAAGSILLLPALPASQRASVSCLSPLGWIPQGWMSLAFLQPFKEQIWWKNTSLFWKYFFLLDWKACQASPLTAQLVNGFSVAIFSSNKQANECLAAVTLLHHHYLYPLSDCTSHDCWSIRGIVK